MSGMDSGIRLVLWRRRSNEILKRMSHWERQPALARKRRIEELAWAARGGRPLSKLLTEVFALVGAAAKSTLGYGPYPEQIMGAIGLFAGRIVEMQTGEGKTLTATMPAVLRGIVGRGCHIVTANDYLASRDAAQMGMIYRELGLSCGCVLDQMGDDDRRRAYDGDITYGTAAQIGFDFLRDRLKTGTPAFCDEVHRMGRCRVPGGVQRGHYCAIVDEADSVLIDDAVTPLLIGLPQENTLASLGLYAWCRAIAARLRPQEDFIYEAEKRRALLTDQGCRRVLLSAKPASLDAVHTERIYEHVETALSALVGLKADRDFVIDEGEIVIVDESTGRKMPGRKWQRGLHQAVEAQQQLEITEQTVHAAQITVQSFFRRYEHLSGMTGTAVSATREFRRVFRLKVVAVPTHRPCRRTVHRPRIFRTSHDKWKAVVSAIAELTEKERAVLVGTPSVAESEGLSRMLREAGIPHCVLNARQDKQEAAIVARAGQPRQVTVATNMAGRGTDIHIDAAVHRAGGLHVIATAMHSASRIDRQLIGRAARQGDPGSCQFFLSLEDPLLQLGLPARVLRKLEQHSRVNGPRELPRRWLKVFRLAQRRLERRERKQRVGLLKAEKRRNESYLKMGLDPFIESPGDD